MQTDSTLSTLSADELASLASRVYVRLRDAIAEGRLATGERLSERGLAETFGVSPAPVRDALHRLEAEGLVQTLPRRGSFVADLGPAKLRQMGRLRAALEGVAAGFAAEQATPAQVDGLLRHLRGLHAATWRVLDPGAGPASRSKALAALSNANDALHAAILAIADHTVLARHLQALRGYDHVMRRRILAANPGEPRLALREHAAIVSAIRRGDAARAEARMRTHTLRSLRLIVEDTQP